MHKHIQTAHHIVTHPQHHLRTPSVLASNWETLKNARGQTVDHDRIGEPAYIIGPARADENSAEIIRIRIRTKVREVATRKGYDLPPSAA